MLITVILIVSIAIFSVGFPPISAITSPADLIVWLKESDIDDLDGFIVDTRMEKGRRKTKNAE